MRCANGEYSIKNQQLARSANLEWRTNGTTRTLTDINPDEAARAAAKRTPPWHR
jgi:hypothetical protein